MKFPQPLVLASQSPRRRELLNSLGLTFKIIAADVDESPIVGESPTEMVKRLATKKAEAIVSAVAPESVIIGADTIVVLKDGSILGKPTSKTDAVEMLKRLSGEEHFVHTGFSLLRSNPAYHFVSCVTSSVEFCQLNDERIQEYVETGEPLDKAGSYAIQGFGAVFVRAIKGSYTNVVGLPLAELYDALSRLRLK